ncbi:MAG TPA: hypothetical protein VK646_13920 [Actinomycetota bacterium]|nr:hypothetical protein [Actinomycetota bacterium]
MSDAEERLAHGLGLLAAGDDAGGVAELEALLPELEGRRRIEALIGIGRSAMWSERTDDALRAAEEALALADEESDIEMRAPALALLSQVLGQRGREGDLGSALELGDRALQVWVAGTRSEDLMQHESLHGLANYWLGRYETAVDLSRRGQDGATECLALAALGLTEASLETADQAVAEAREADSSMLTAYALCCSTAALRDVRDLAEARRRNAEALELYRTIGFESGAMQAEIDLLAADLEDDPASAERAWPALWARLGEASGWERWLAPGRLSVLRAELAVRRERWQDALEAALEAIEVAHRIGRAKVQVSARIVLGEAQLALGRPFDALAELGAAAEAADALAHPPTRWRAYADLSRAAAAAGDDLGAATASAQAATVAKKYVAALTPEHADRLVATPALAAILAT